MPNYLALPAEPWRRNLQALRVTGFTAYFGFVFASPLLPLYLRDLLGALLLAARAVGRNRASTKATEGA